MSRSGGPRPVDLGSLSGLERLAGDAGQPTVVLLHGFGGDERSMWIFGPALPKTWRVVALRGVTAARPTGFRWHRGARWPPPPAEVFRESVAAVGEALGGEAVVWIGFSQGAALAFACAAGGLPTLGLAALAGYLPKSLGRLPTDLPVFWAHGARDDSVPIEHARRGVDRLGRERAVVEFCETETGHKVGAACLRALSRWLTRFDEETNAT